jgi:hypothetical protein
MQSDLLFRIKRNIFSKFFSIYDVLLVCRMSEPFLKVETKREDDSSDESSSDEEKKKRFSSQQVLKNTFPFSESLQTKKLEVCLKSCVDTAMLRRGEISA